MNIHDEYIELISAALDGALSPDGQAKLDAHLESCPDCKALYDQLWVSAKAVKGLPPVEPPADLTDRIMAAVKADNVVQFIPKKTRQPWRKWAATAAVLAVIVAGGYTATRIMGGADSAKNTTLMMAPAMQAGSNEAAPADAEYANEAILYGTVENAVAENETNETTMDYSYAVESDPAAAPDTGDNASAKKFSAETIPAPAEEPSSGETTDNSGAELDPGLRTFMEAVESTQVGTWYSLQGGGEAPEESAAGEGEPESALVTSFAIATNGSEPTESKEAPVMDTVTVTINGKTFEAQLNDSPAAQALREALPLTLDMAELGGNEKYRYLDFSLPAEARAVGEIHTGDLMLFGDSCLVLFYENFSTGYTYTPLGALTDPAGLAEALGSGDVTVTFSAE